MNKLPLLELGHRGGIRFKKDGSNRRTPIFVFVALIGLVFLVLFIRLFQLTVVKGSYYQSLSEENRLREITIEAPRGKIVDRKGFVIAESEVPDTSTLEERYLSKRTYYSPESVSHLIGFRQIADKQDLENDHCLNKLKLGDKIGKKGVEKLYDCDLRGRSGKKLVEVDAGGRAVKNGLVNIVPYEAGKTVRLSVELDLQKKAAELLSGKKGVIVALKPSTGEILALVSSPGFNPQDFEDQNQETVKKYFDDKSKPLFNRATEGVYPPGSIFKLIIASAGLEEKKIDNKTLFEDTGKIKAGPLEFGNWYFLQYGKTEGMVDIIKAVRRSNDIFFYHVGALLGPEKIKAWSEKFGLGKKTGLGLDEATGTIPSPFWKEEALNDRWYLGDTYNLSIGQGYLQTTPLQLAQMTAVFANNGNLCKPQLLKGEKPKCIKLPLSEKNLVLIKEGMKQACSPGGTGWPLFQFGISLNQSPTIRSGSVKISQSKSEKTDSEPILTDSNRFQPISTACKTGTAELYTYSKTPHAWFTVYAPAENPEIVLTILVEEGGQGSDIAGPLAKEMLKVYFERNE